MDKMRLGELIERGVEVKKDTLLIEVINTMIRKISGYTDDTDVIVTELEKLRVKRHEELNRIVDEIDEIPSRGE